MDQFFSSFSLEKGSSLTFLCAYLMAQKAGFKLLGCTFFPNANKLGNKQILWAKDQTRKMTLSVYATGNGCLVGPLGDEIPANKVVGALLKVVVPDDFQVEVPSTEL